MFEYIHMCICGAKLWGEKTTDGWMYTPTYNPPPLLNQPTHPTHTPHPTQVSRCLTLLSQSKPAALAFYARLREHVGLGPVARLMAMLIKCVFAALADQVRGEEERGWVGEDAGQGGVRD